MSRLSEREAQVVKLAAAGHTDERIANELDITVATVRGYWLRIRTKLGGSSRAELVGQWVRSTNDVEGDRVSQAHKDQTQVHHEDFAKVLADEREAIDEIFKTATPEQLKAIKAARKKSDGNMQDALDRSREQVEAGE